MPGETDARLFAKGDISHRPIHTNVFYSISIFLHSLTVIMDPLDKTMALPLSASDTHGHAAGDAALRTVAETCRGVLRQSDIVGRFGGEEFVILLPETDHTAAAKIAQKLRMAIGSSAYSTKIVPLS